MAAEVTTTKKYDVAISFLVQDLTLAQSIRDKLNKSLEVFFFPHNQEELAGTDGLESMREPFFDGRVNLVLYRERWGNTPWTRVEATAIKEACLEQGWDGLFFFMAEPKDVPPKWLPKTHVRLNYGEFTLDQAIGAIKARVQEQGGHFVPMTPLKRVQILKADDDYRRAKLEMSSNAGLAKVSDTARELFTEIERHASELNLTNHLHIETEIDFRDGTVQKSILIRNEFVSMRVAWRQPYDNTLQSSGLYVTEFNLPLLFKSELNRRMYLVQPQQIDEKKYMADLSRSGEYGWKSDWGQHEFISSHTLAEKCVIQFLDLVERYNAGQISRAAY